MKSVSSRVRYWVAAGIALALSVRLLFDHLWMLAVVPVGLWAIAGVVLIGLSAWQSRIPELYSAALRDAGAVAVGVFLFLPVASLGSYVTQRLRFAWHRSAYEGVVARVAAQPVANGRATGGGLQYIVDDGPPRRVAFVWPGGVVDNWCGAVHDPSGEVLRVNHLPLWSEQWRAASLTRLFGGDMTSCKSLGGSYYLCCFT